MYNYRKFCFVLLVAFVSGTLRVKCVSASVVHPEESGKKAAIVLPAFVVEHRINQPRDLLNLWEPTANLNRFLYRIEQFELWNNQVKIYDLQKPKVAISKAFKIKKTVLRPEIEACYQAVFDREAGLLLLSCSLHWKFG